MAVADGAFSCRGASVGAEEGGPVACGPQGWVLQVPSMLSGGSNVVPEKKPTRPLAVWFSLRTMIMPKPCMALMIVLCLPTMAKSVMGSDGWHRFRAVTHSHFAGPSFRIHSHCRMCAASSSPELLLLVPMMRKQCSRVPSGCDVWWWVRKLLPLESDV